MKHAFVFFFLLLFGVHPGVARQQASKDVGKSLLWEISGRDLKEPSYLFGTYHLVGKSFLDTLPLVMEKFRNVSTVAGEVVMTDQMEMAQKLMPLMVMKDNKLDKILSVAEFAEVDSFMQKKTGMALAVMNQLKPSAVQLTLVAILSPKDVSPSNPALDMFFQKEARETGKQVEAFETVEEQARLLLDIPLARQKELLLKTVRRSEKMVQESKKLFLHYKERNMLALEEDFQENDDFTPDEMEALLNKRNRHWMEKLPAMMSSGSVFVAVGAGHLLGEQGLVSLLRNAGYTVQALPVK